MATQLSFPKQIIPIKNYVGNKYLDGQGSELISVRSPYTGEIIGELHSSTKAEVNQAVACAQKGFMTWREIPIKERCERLLRFRELVVRNLDELTNYTAIESGKTFGEARAGILKGIEVTDFAISLQNSDLGGAIEVSRGVTCQYRREPLGVVAGIAPFNFPAMVPLWMYPIAIATGNSFILKPSEKVPVTSHFIAALFADAGFPEGVFNTINGNKDVAQSLALHPDVKAVGFVGSTPVAKAIYQMTTHAGKRCLALGGAKNHLILAPDADPQIAVGGIVDSFTGCAGQRCMAASLLLAVGDCDDVLDKVIRRAEQIEVGTHMGALIDLQAKERIYGIIERAEKEGAKILLDGRKKSAPKGFENGYWLAPTIIEAKSTSMECAQTEIFGPVLTIVRVNSLQQALELENSNPFGNATSVFTTSGGVADYVSRRASNGMIGINIGVPVPREPFSFGGTKESKFGHGDITGESGVNFWSDLKKITAKWTLQKDHNWMS